MIIHQPEIITQEKHTTAWAKVEYKDAGEKRPEFLWYRVPRQYTDFISLHSDSFLIPGLLAGMFFGENIEVRGVVSPRLAYHLEEYQHLLSFRHPNFLHQVDIKYDQIKPINKISQGVGTTFSGGADSLFTLRNHLPQTQLIPNYQISHALFIDGFDILITNQSKYQKLFSIYQDVLTKINIELVSLETNIFSLLAPKMKHVYFYGPILGGCAHILAGLFKIFFISSSSDYHQLKNRAFSSDPLIDPFLSTDSMEIIHYGAAFPRVEKIAAISDWDLAQDILRVCSNLTNPEELLNCSRCEKCVRTMIPIYALGKMEKFNTFAKPLTRNRDGLWWARKFNPAPVFDYIPEMFPFVRKHKPDFLPWLRVAALLGYLRFWLLKILPRSIKKMLRRFGFFIDILEGESAFENPKVVQLINSINSEHRKSID